MENNKAPTFSTLHLWPSAESTGPPGNGRCVEEHRRLLCHVYVVPPALIVVQCSQAEKNVSFIEPFNVSYRSNKYWAERYHQSDQRYGNELLFVIAMLNVRDSTSFEFRKRLS